jgi:prepilin-type N-terminal cleavage/methylation domain-containing protein
MSHLLKSRSRNSAFTLVELLIVIAIIGILASLATVGVMKALEKGKMVAARTEISQLEAAIAAAKQNLSGVDNLPSAIRLYNTPAGFNTDALGVSTSNFLTKAFGKAWQSSPACPWMGVGYTGTYPVTLTGMEALVYWLGGVRDGSRTFQGFSSNPSAPWDTTNAKYKIKGPFYEFDAIRVLNNTPTTVPTFVNSWNGSYAYFSSADYSNFSKTIANGGYNAYSSTGGSISPLLRTATTFYNPKTFQIISSGPDQSFGKGCFGGGTTFGVVHTPGSGDYAIAASGYDDLANFSSTQLGKKDE